RTVRWPGRGVRHEQSTRGCVRSWRDCSRRNRLPSGLRRLLSVVSSFIWQSQSFQAAFPSSCLRIAPFLGRLTVPLLFDSLADHIQYEARNRRATRLEESFHGLLSSRILDEDLAEQRYFPHTLLHAAFDHFLDNICR